MCLMIPFCAKREANGCPADYWRWYAKLNFLSYSWNALMINQFRHEVVGVYDNIEVPHIAPKAGIWCNAHVNLVRPRVSCSRRL